MYKSFPWKYYGEISGRACGHKDATPTSCGDQGNFLEKVALWRRRQSLPGKEIELSRGREQHVWSSKDKNKPRAAAGRLSEGARERDKA